MIGRSTTRILGVRHVSARFLSFSLPKIATLESLKATEQDFSGLWSNNTINELWFKRGQELVNGLNASLEQSTVSTSRTSSLMELIGQTIQQPELFGIYAYASLLFNLQFSLESLKENNQGKIIESQANDLLKTPTSNFENIPRNEKLHDWLVDSFGSIEEFRTLLLNSAKSIKGDGYVWLVAESNLSESVLKSSPNIANPGSVKSPVYNNLAIVNTYNVGIVEDSIRSGQINRLKLQKSAKIAALKSKQQERIDSGTDVETVYTSEENELLGQIDQLDQEIQNLTLGTVEEAEFNTLYSDKKLLPLLAIDASQRNYLLDYGVFGKQQYLDNLWECIDWDVVINRLPERTKKLFH